MIAYLLITMTSLATPLTPTAGVEWTPFSRADAAWVSEERTSGTAVGEFDGIVRPQLNPFVGAWIDNRWGLTASLGIGRLQQTTWADEIFLQRHWLVVRPSLDMRVALIKRDRTVPIPWVLVGAHGDIPSAAERSNGFTEEELENAELNGQIERAKLGGFGARVGLGVDYGIQKHIRIGLQGYGLWHRTVFRSSETQQVSSWIGTQASFIIAFEWPTAIN